MTFVVQSFTQPKNMKKIFLSLATASLLIILSPTYLKAETSPTTSLTVVVEDTENMDILLIRYNEIKSMDMTGMSRKEKKRLREEMRFAGKKLNDHGHHGGVYLSGSLVVVILLLIILL